MFLCDTSSDPVTKAESTTRCGSMWVKVGLALSLILSPVGPVDPVERNSIELQYVTEEVNAYCLLSSRSFFYLGMNIVGVLRQPCG